MDQMFLLLDVCKGEDNSDDDLDDDLKVIRKIMPKSKLMLMRKIKTFNHLNNQQPMRQTIYQLMIINQTHQINLKRKLKILMKICHSYQFSPNTNHH
jgi:hypothetical protein